MDIMATWKSVWPNIKRVIRFLLIFCVVVVILGIIAMGGNVIYNIYYDYYLGWDYSKDTLGIGFFTGELLHASNFRDWDVRTFSKERLIAELSFSDKVDRNKPHDYQLVVLPLDQKKIVYSHKIHRKPGQGTGSGFVFDLPAKQWSDGTYLFRVYRDGQLIITRTADLYSDPPLWYHFPWVESLGRKLMRWAF